MSLSSEDEKISELLDILGPEGYGIYWLILEKLAWNLEKGSDETNVKYSANKWAKICKKNPRGMRKIYQTFAYLSLMIFKTYDKHMHMLSISYANDMDMNLISSVYYIDISCPNLLKYRDEYSKKSGQTPDRLRTDSGQTPDQETETETETELKKNEFSDDEEKPKKHSKKKSGEIEKPENVSEQTWEDFISHRKDKKAKITKTALNGIINQAKKAGWELEDALIELVTRGWTGFKSDWVTKKTSTKTTSDKMARMRKQTQELLNG